MRSAATAASRSGREITGPAKGPEGVVNATGRPEVLPRLGEGDGVAQRGLVLAPGEQVLRDRRGRFEGEAGPPGAGPGGSDPATESSAARATPARNRASASESSPKLRPGRAREVRKGTLGANHNGIVANSGALRHTCRHTCRPKRRRRRWTTMSDKFQLSDIRDIIERIADSDPRSPI
jgi:hypothetical protein